MRKLSLDEIKKFASRKGVRRIAIENFLMSMGSNYDHALINLEIDTQLYKWNKRTIKAIRDGISLASKIEKIIKKEVM